ncbi:hypothetical protein AVEN_155195-1 [Araneus ventricosus]|uniref:Uncharacterized protein n=1 Tax=Araneus ventricosus TaxID=182803 RepID=A0A4Y2RKB6_ARAVE|nr:hypothetical protein AVEN_155195-1 [Araneus ventricosus]
MLLKRVHLQSLKTNGCFQRMGKRTWNSYKYRLKQKKIMSNKEKDLLADGSIKSMNYLPYTGGHHYNPSRGNRVFTGDLPDKQVTLHRADNHTPTRLVSHFALPSHRGLRRLSVNHPPVVICILE